MSPGQGIDLPHPCLTSRHVPHPREASLCRCAAPLVLAAEASLAVVCDVRGVGQPPETAAVVTYGRRMEFVRHLRGALRSGVVIAAAGGLVWPALSQTAVAQIDVGVAPQATRSAPQPGIDLARWSGRRLHSGDFLATRVHNGTVVLGKHPDHVRYRDPYAPHPGFARAYVRGRWFSPWHATTFGLTQLIASYDARTPPGTFIEVSVRGQATTGRRSSWDSLGRWTSGDQTVHRMSLGRQPDDLAHVAVDTWVANRRPGLARWQLRVSLYRRSHASQSPVLSMIGAVASRLPDRGGATSTPGPGRGRDLAVPAFSQMIHQGEYPQWNGGGEAWCSPTSTAMVLAYWHRGPTPRQYAWVKPSYAQPWVDYAARFTYAWGYGGSGMWPFNTAYAARFNLDAFVARLPSLRRAEAFIRAGIPLVASIAFGPGQLSGAPIRSTSGHLVVIRGFTRHGRVIVNDPAAPTARTVRRVYARGQFERAWVGGSGGVVYVIHPASVPLPG